MIGPTRLTSRNYHPQFPTSCDLVVMRGNSTLYARAYIERSRERILQRGTITPFVDSVQATADYQKGPAWD